MFPWEKYSSNLYVQRQIEFDRLLNWIRSTSVLKQVTSLVAPPGSGKSWFLQAVQEELKAKRVSHSPAAPERLVIFCDAPTLVNRNQTSGAGLNQDAVFEWLEKIIGDAKPIYPAVASVVLDRSREAAAIISDLVRIFCAEHPPKPTVVVLVDGLDDIPDQALTVENQILEPFIGKECIRMVVAHRDELGLKNPTLRRNNGEPARVHLEPFPSVEEQFKKFKDEFYSRATHLTDRNLDQFKRSLTHYQWNHPYINAFLFDVALKQPGGDVTHLLTTENFRECLYAVIERRDKKNQPRFGELEKETFDCLKRIASGLPDEWTLTDLQKTLELKEQDERMKRLFDLGVVFNKPKTGRYKIADGIRELARDLVERGG